MGILRRVAWASLWTVGGTGAARAFNLIATILIARFLGKQDFGAYGLILSTLGVFGIFAGSSLGLTATRFVAQYRRTEPERAGEIIALVGLIALVTTAVVCLVVMATALPVATFFLGAPRLYGALALGSVVIAFTTARGMQDGIIIGFEDFRFASILKIVEGLICLLAGPFLASRYGITGAMLGLIGGLAASSLCGLIYISRLLRRAGARLSLKGAWQRNRSALGGFATPSYLSSLIAMPSLWLATVLLGRQPGGLAALGAYGAAYQWHGPIVFLAMALCSATLPALVVEWEAGRVASFKRTFMTINLASSGGTALFALVMIQFGQAIMSWYGAEFQQDHLVLAVLLLATPLHVMADISGVALQSMNRAWTIFWSNVRWSVVLLVASYLLAPRWGALGLAAAYAGAYAVQAIGRSVQVAMVLGRSTASDR